LLLLTVAVVHVVAARAPAGLVPAHTGPVAARAPVGLVPVRAVHVAPAEPALALQRSD